MKHLADLLPTQERHELAMWIIKYGGIQRTIAIDLSQGDITSSQFLKYSGLLSKALTNKLYKS